MIKKKKKKNILNNSSILGGGSNVEAGPIVFQNFFFFIFFFGDGLTGDTLLLLCWDFIRIQYSVSPAMSDGRREGGGARDKRERDEE